MSNQKKIDKKRKKAQVRQAARRERKKNTLRPRTTFMTGSND